MNKKEVAEFLGRSTVYYGEDERCFRLMESSANLVQRVKKYE